VDGRDGAARPGVQLRPAHVRAFLSVAEARQLTAFLVGRYGERYLWPGFDFGRVPVCFFSEGPGDPGVLEAFVVQHPDPPAGFEPLTIPIPGLDRVPVHYHRGPLPYLPAVGPVRVDGRAWATLPLSVFRSDVLPETLVAGVVHEVFHAYDYGLGRGRVDLSQLSAYPELSATNNALGNIEARVLYDYLVPRLGRPGSDGGAAPDQPGRPDEAARKTALEFCLIRRERRGPLEDEIIEYEKGLERAEGPARYVQLRALLGALSEDYSPSKAFQILSGRKAYTKARELVAEQLGKLPELNIHAAGAAWWRFFHTGMAMALLADSLDPDWKDRVNDGQSLDRVIERHVVYDGGAGDERAIELVKERYGYDERLDAEREFGRQEKRRKESLLASLLTAEGTRITFDVSALIPDETYLESGRFEMTWDPGSVDTVTRNVRIHKHGLRFAGFGTDLRFGDLPVVEDLKNRLFHVTVPGTGRLSLLGDGHRCSLLKPALFEEGLEVTLPGVSAKARSGYVQNTGETLYIKITR